MPGFVSSLDAEDQEVPASTDTLRETALQLSHIQCSSTYTSQLVNTLPDYGVFRTEKSNANAETLYKSGR